MPRVTILTTLRLTLFNFAVDLSGYTRACGCNRIFVRERNPAYKSPTGSYVRENIVELELKVRRAIAILQRDIRDLRYEWRFSRDVAYDWTATTSYFPITFRAMKYLCKNLTNGPANVSNIHTSVARMTNLKRTLKKNQSDTIFAT